MINTSANPIIVVGQVYAHPVTACMTVVYKVKGDEIYYTGFDLKDGGTYDFDSKFTGRMYDDTFLESFTSIPLEDLFNMDLELKNQLLAQCPDGTFLTQGCIVDLESDLEYA